MAKMLSPIEHIVVVMLEDRSFDKMVGPLYADGSSPSQLLPAGSANGSAGYISGSPEGKGPGRLNRTALNLRFDSVYLDENVFSRLSANIGISPLLGVTAGVSIRFRVLEHRKINPSAMPSA
jgi:hypothetical protein